MLEPYQTLEMEQLHTVADKMEQQHRFCLWEDGLAPPTPAPPYLFCREPKMSMVSRWFCTPNDVIYVSYANVAPKDIEHDTDDKQSLWSADAFSPFNISIASYNNHRYIIKPKNSNIYSSFNHYAQVARPIL